MQVVGSEALAAELVRVSDLVVRAKRLQQAVETGTITAATGEDIQIRFESVCVHSDGSTAVDVARACREYLDGVAS